MYKVINLIYCFSELVFYLINLLDINLIFYICGSILIRII